MKDKKPAQYRGMTVTEVNPEGPNALLHIVTPSGKRIPIGSCALILETGHRDGLGRPAIDYLESEGVRFHETTILSSYLVGKKDSGRALGPQTQETREYMDRAKDDPARAIRHSDEGIEDLTESQRNYPARVSVVFSLNT